MKGKTHNPVTLAASPAGLRTLQRHFARFAAAHALPPDAVYAGRIVLEELVVNVISHGSADPPRHTIIVDMQVADGVLTLTLTDDASPFNPLAAPAPEINAPVAERPVGGCGIYLVRQLTDQMTYQREGGRNIVTISKRYALKPPSLETPAIPPAA